MKKILYLAVALCTGLCACAAPAASVSPASDNPLSGLGKILGGASSSQTKDSGSKSGLGGALGGLVSGLLGTDKVSAEKMVGTWSYVSPAVCFKSENFLQKAGGSAIAGTIESKMAPYYQTLGLNKLVLTVKDDKSFTMTSGKLKMSGTIETDGQGDVFFNFTALGKVKLGKMKAYVTISGNQLSLMFDVTKLVSILKAVGSVTGNSTVNAVTGILDSYDGICAGFKLRKS